MTKDRFREEVREYLDEHYTRHLRDKAYDTEDIEELRYLVRLAKNIYSTYIHDADIYLTQQLKSS